MTRLLPWLGAVLTVAAAADLARAQYYPNPAYPYAPPMQARQAPSACGPGYYSVNNCGGVYGPNYYLQPPFPPFNGFRPNFEKKQQGNPAFPTHPFARGPRDFFMLDP